MEIYIFKNGQQLGPYSENAIRNGIASGQYTYTDFGWHSGITDWQPLSQVLSNLPQSNNATAPLQSSGLAKTSFIMALATFGVWIFLIVLYNATHNFRNIDEVIGLIIFLIIACVAVNITGLVFGIIGTTRSISNKWMAIVGMIMNTIGFFMLTVLFID